MAGSEDVVILRNPAGTPQHAVMTWERYEWLRRAAEGVTAPAPIELARRLAEGVSALRAWREDRGFSQAQLAALTGISRVYLSQIETGERAGTVEVMAGLARNLGCRIEDLLRNYRDEFAMSVAALARMPARLRELTAAIPEDRWRVRVPGSEFSLLEQICHLRDIDHDGYRVRIARMLDEAMPELADIDGTKLARERDYQRQDLHGALAAFIETRAGIVQQLRGLTPAQQARTGRLEAAGVISVADLVGAMIAHDSGHIDELAMLGDQLAKEGG